MVGFCSKWAIMTLAVQAASAKTTSAYAKDVFERPRRPYRSRGYPIPNFRTDPFTLAGPVSSIRIFADNNMKAGAYNCCRYVKAMKIAVRFQKRVCTAGHRRCRDLRLSRGLSWLTRIWLPSNSAPSNALMASRASWPSMSIVAKPLHSPENISLASFIERTVPDCENNAVTLSSVADRGRPRTKSVIT